LIYTLLIAGLMVSRLPVFSGKRVGKRVPPEMVLPLIVVVVLFVALLIAYPWQVLTIGTICYIAALPMSWLSYREHQRLDAVQLASQAPVNVDIDQTMPPEPPRDPDRPARLN
jgi:CDP-diacylglycerol--serine O-phosphatidyltransferase